MTRAEFLQGLRTELEGRVPYSVIQENIRYYDSYISDEISKGADEAEVIENLGGPREESYQDTYHRNVHYVDFSKWYVRLAAGLIVFFIIFLLMSLFFGIIGLAGWVLSYIWPVLLILMIFWMFKGPGR